MLLDKLKICYEQNTNLQEYIYIGLQEISSFFKTQ